MKKIVALLLFISVFSSCKKDDKILPPSPIIGGKIDFTFLNENKQDLFNPNTPNHLEVSDFKVYSSYYPGDKTYGHYITAVLNGSRFFDVDVINERRGELYVQDTLFLEIGSLKVDTIVHLSKRYGSPTGLIAVEKFYYNGQEFVPNEMKHRVGPFQVIIDANHNSHVSILPTP